jgi:hypothetical protein
MGIISVLLPSLMEVIGKFITSDADKAKAQAEITRHLLENEASLVNSAKEVVKAEIESESKLAKNWRPILMYLLMSLLVWIVAIAPVFGLVSATKESLEAVPGDLWSLLMIGMGGYILGRTGENIVKTIKGKS